MSKIAKFAGILATALLALMWVIPAQAQATRTWVSGVGDDANPCSRTAPCKTFAGAISKTATNGQINCIDPGGFGALTITKSIAIQCDNTEAGVLVSGTNGIVVNAPGAIVYLSGLDIQGLGTGLIGISFLSGSELHVRNCVVREFQSGTAVGINFAPTTVAQLFVNDSVISDNGTAATGGGIFVKPGAGGTASASIAHIVAQGNGVGIQIDGNGGSTSRINATITDTVLTGNVNAGLSGNATGAAVVAVVADHIVASNGSGATAAGIKLNGSAVNVILSNSVLSGNNIGVSNTGGTILSFNSTKNIANTNASASAGSAGTQY